MKGFDILKIKPAVRGLNPMKFHFNHLTTMEIGQVVPLGVFDMIPRDEFNKVHTRVFSRLAPLSLPTYGNFKFKTVAAFVPYHMISVDAEAWIDGKTSWEGYTPHTRYFGLKTLLSYFAGSTYGLSEDATSLSCDFTYVNSSGTRLYRKFTEKGKYYYKILVALGYTLPSGADFQTSSAWQTQMAGKKLSAYPLLCFFKIYNDYMSQSQRFNTSLLSNFLSAVKYNRAYTGLWDSATGEILMPGLNAMFTSLLVNYENDYFTSAWQSPNSPLANIENVSTMFVPESNGSVINDGLGDNVATVPGGVGTTLPQRVLDFLRSFDNWVRRNNYAGSRVVQQIYARFGIKTSDYRDHYAEVLDVGEFPIQVGDVTATADASGVPLGAYAGKGLLSAEFDVSYKAKDYGMLLILGFITVVPMMSYGFDRRVLRVDPMDYYQPEFDGLGADAISVGEVYADPLDESLAVLDNATFGFTERYNSYRYMRDVISGDFRNFRNDADINAWHTGRNLSAVRAAGQLLAQSSAMNTLSPTDSEYNRIFNQVSVGADHFYMTCTFDLDTKRPMKSLNQVTGLGVGNTIVPRNGNVIS